MPEARIGCSGWAYDEWRDDFYPHGLPKSQWLEYYTAHFRSVEVNGTFYGLPKAATFEAWRAQAPEGFCFALKLSQFGTHRKRLKDPATWLSRFMERAELLGATLGPILVQLPPRWGADPARLDEFLTAAPATRRFAVEVRDERWFCGAVYEVLARHDAALVHHDLIAAHPRPTTASFVYLRFHGPTAAHRGGEAYAGRYSPQALGGAARRIRRHLAEGRDVYAYFNNDIGGEAPRDAKRLLEALEG